MAKLSSEAAEFFVLAHLLIEEISAFKAYVNFPGYDLIATNAETNRSARIQVKSRLNSDWNHFLINKFSCDFVVFVALNRGYGSNPNKGAKDPQFYVMPQEYALKISDDRSSWGKITKKNLRDNNYEKECKDRWDLIRNFLLQKSTCP